MLVEGAHLGSNHLLILKPNPIPYELDSVKKILESLSMSMSMTGMSEQVVGKVEVPRF